MRGHRIILGAILLITIAAPTTKADDAEDKAVQFIEKLGGSVVRDEKVDSKPVVEVCLQGTLFADADMKELAALKSLEALDLCATRFTDDGLAELTAFKRLQVLNLSCTKVTDAGLKKLADVEKLQRLYVIRTAVTDDGMKDLAAAKKRGRLRIVGPGTKGMVDLLSEGGGNKASEAAVVRGLAWLATAQKPNGSWESDGAQKAPVASSGMGLLPFLAAGHTQNGGPKIDGKENKKHVKNVADGLDFLLKRQRETGDFGTQDMYQHAMATMALCEAYGITHDEKLRAPAQKAVDFIVKAQHTAGGWRYMPNQAGDTSVTGWQIQALRSAQLAGLDVPRETLQKTMLFLDSVAGGTRLAGTSYGYTDKNGSPSMTAVGLLCRQYLGWSRARPAITEGVMELRRIPPPDKGKTGMFDIYYYYYASQVVHNCGVPEWHVFWNPLMRDWLTKLQVIGNEHTAGGWDPDQSITGSAGGRLFTTCMALLTLEIYYRHPPTYTPRYEGLRPLE
jgi:Leucine Rich repeat